MAIRTGTKWTGWETDKFQGWVDYRDEVEDIVSEHCPNWTYSHSPVVKEVLGPYRTKAIVSDHVYYVDQCGNEVASWNAEMKVLLVFGTPRKVDRGWFPDGMRYYRNIE